METVHDVHIAAVSLWLPKRRDAVEDAIAEGRADEQQRDRDGYLELPVSTDLAAPEMAVAAATEALATAGLAGERLGFTAHAWIYHQGHDFWSPAHFVAAGVGALEALPVGVQQMCNGGATAVQIALDRMAADPDLEAALVTTGDRFAAPVFDRWRGDYAVAYGDGATALVLTRGPGRYRVRGLATTAAPAMEWMHRGDDPFSDSARENGGAVDVRRTKKVFMAAGGGPLFASTAVKSVTDVLHRALAQAGVELEDRRLRCVALPRLGTSVLDDAYRPALDGLLPQAELFDFGRTTGHLGAGDAAANLASLDELSVLESGDMALLISAGAGFTWSCLVVEAV
ncbi:ketoacyl-ACP synthase III family protein [Streptomyces sp.]|uniref:ketoacyl-ACP synthase III family protein n=1 Tax=Streptomyces sp. TaxID=1931 RepID=UPI002F425F09